MQRLVGAAVGLVVCPTQVGGVHTAGGGSPPAEARSGGGRQEHVILLSRVHGASQRGAGLELALEWKGSERS